MKVETVEECFSSFLYFSLKDSSMSPFHLRFFARIENELQVE